LVGSTKKNKYRYYICTGYTRKHICSYSAIPADIIEKRIKDIEKQVNKLLDLYQLETIPLEEVNKRIYNSTFSLRIFYI